MTPVTPSFDDDERALARALHGRVDHMNESPLQVKDISTKAQGIRRRRAVTATVGVAAAVAILVPAGIAAGGLFDDKPEPPVTSQSSTPTRGAESPTPTPTEAPTSQVLDVKDLATGDVPLVAWAEVDFQGYDPRGGTIHAVDGTETPLPDLSLRSFAPLGDGYLVNMWDPETLEESVIRLDREGSTLDSWAADGGMVASAGGNVVAWTDPTGQVYAAHGATGDVLTMPAIEAKGPYRTIGISSEDCMEGRTTDAGCSIVVNTNGRNPQTFVTSSHGIVDTVPGMIAATAASGRFVAGMTSIDEFEPGSCSRMLQDLTTELWTTCDNTPSRISPDNTMLVGLPDYLDGFGPSNLDILAMSDGKPIRSWTSDQASATFFDETWEDETHVLVVTFQDNEWAVVRLGADGSMEYAIAPVEASMDHNPFRLALH